MVWSSLTSKWPIPVPFCGMNHQKSSFLLISDTFSVRGCWGQLMSFFFQNWLMKHKSAILLKPLGTIIKENYWSFYPWEPFRIIPFNMKKKDKRRLFSETHHMIYKLRLQKPWISCLKFGLWDDNAISRVGMALITKNPIWFKSGRREHQNLARRMSVLNRKLWNRKHIKVLIRGKTKTVQ